MALVKSKQSGKLSKLESMLKSAQGQADDISINTVSISVFIFVNIPIPFSKSSQQPPN